MRCAIVDDRADDRERLASAVEAYCASRAFDGVCERFASAEAFVAGYRASRFDVVFLDGYLDDGEPSGMMSGMMSDGASSDPASDGGLDGMASDDGPSGPASDVPAFDRPSGDAVTGLTVARWLRAHGYAGPIVFVTVSADFAVAGYGVDAAAYLLKPFSRSDVDAVLDKLLHAPRMFPPSAVASASVSESFATATSSASPSPADWPANPARSIRSARSVPFPEPSARHARANVVEFDIGLRAASAIREVPPARAGSYGGLYVVADGPSGEAMLRVDMDRLAFCRADRHHVVFHDVRDPAASALTVRMGFAQVEDALAKWPRFLTCARGYIVNLDAVAGMDGDAFLLSGGTRVPVSRRRAAEAKARYADHVFTAMRGDDPASPFTASSMPDLMPSASDVSTASSAIGSQA